MRCLRQPLSPWLGRLQPPPQRGQGGTPLPSQARRGDGGELSCTPTCTQEKGARPGRLSGAGADPAVVGWEGGGSRVSV